MEDLGEEMKDNTGVGGIDPVGITDDGELLGEFVCEDCMKAGK